MSDFNQINKTLPLLDVPGEWLAKVVHLARHSLQVAGF